jgi:hypothetical protein
MKMKRYVINLLAALFILLQLSSCHDSATPIKQPDTSTQINNEIPSYQDKSTKSRWMEQFDFDGDGQNDYINYEFTGGGHCCYKIKVTLSSDQMERKFPFEMDGGYVGGLDISNPHQFDIRDIDNDGLPEILMEIATYNGSPYPIPKNWKKKYGIKSHHIVIEYEKGKLIVKDQK